MSRTARILVGFLALLLVVCLAVWGVGSLLTRATNAPVPPPDLPACAVSIPSEDGIVLAGSYWPASPVSDRAQVPAILMLHGNGSSRASMSATARWLNQNGYAVLAVDFRGHGESTPADKSFGFYEARDAHAAYDWLARNNPGGRVGVIGFSLGGAASLLGEAGPLHADALVLIAVFPDIRRAIANRLAIRLGNGPAKVMEPLLSYQSLPRFGVKPSAIAPIRTLGQVSAPVMIVGGGADRNTPPSEARAMFSAVHGPGELHILPGLDHNSMGGALPEDFNAALLQFLDRHLKVSQRGETQERPRGGYPSNSAVGR